MKYIAGCPVKLSKRVGKHWLEEFGLSRDEVFTVAESGSYPEGRKGRRTGFHLKRADGTIVDGVHFFSYDLIPA